MWSFEEAQHVAKYFRGKIVLGKPAPGLPECSAALLTIGKGKLSQICTILFVYIYVPTLELKGRTAKNVQDKCRTFLRQLKRNGNALEKYYS